MELNGQIAPFRYADLFAGVGGFAAALNTFGGEFAHGAEIDQKASNTYFLNFGHRPLGDIRDLASRAETLQAFEVISGGFPCQPFSKSGLQKGVSEPRGNLFDDIARIVEAKRPLIVFLENVRNLAGPKHLDEWNRIIAVLRGLGYRVSSRPAEISPHLLPRESGGRPQHRVRIYITATLNPGSDGINREDPEPAWTADISQIPVWNLRTDLPLQDRVHDKYSLDESEIACLKAWDEWIEYFRLNDFGKLPGFPIWSDFWTQALPSGFHDYPDWKRNFVTKNMEFYRNHRDFADRWLAKHRVRSVMSPSRRKFEWQAGQLDTLWDGLIQFRPSGIRVKTPNYVPTLVALNQTPIYGPLRRRITEHEAALLQGFPRNFALNHQDAKASYKQMGNAVNVGVTAHIFRMHCLRDQDLLRMSEAGTKILEAVLATPTNPDEVFKKWDERVAPGSH